jgi:hypothetical protein
VNISGNSVGLYLQRLSFAFFFLASILIFSAIPSQAQLLTPAWVELGPDGAAIARVVVNAPQDCPIARIEHTKRRMILRPNTPNGFRPVCEIAIPASAKSVSVNKQKLVLPRPNPTRIVAFGDTGCRIKGSDIQDCNDPQAEWPFQLIASQAAQEKPQLMIHVGDYLYRESTCPPKNANFCGGTPAGDNWDAWNADFFEPAAKLLSAVPWAFARGNHEDCNRSWRGWFYYLDPRPWTGFCQAYSAPYMIKLGTFELVVLDSSDVSELSSAEEPIAQYAAALSSFHPENAWLVDHHPFWGFASAPGGFAVPISVPLEEAWNRANPQGYTLILSGHIHIFEFVNLDQGRPDQLVLGDGGTELSEPLKAVIKGVGLRGVTTTGGESQPQFGYTFFTKKNDGWDFVLKSPAGKPLINCHLPGNASDCKPAGE